MKNKSLNPKQKVRDTAKKAAKVNVDQQNACCDCGPTGCPPGCCPPGCCR